jgi:hypothetical protein
MSRVSGRTTAARHRQVHMAAAVAREAVMQLHVEHALALIHLAAGRVPELRILEIYLRLLDLSGVAAEAVANRVLAALGGAHPEHAVRALSGLDDGRSTDTAGDDVAADDRSLMRTLRRRLRGRVHDELRTAIELQVGVVKTALLATHVSHAHGFVRMLADTHDTAGACAAYTANVHVPPALAGVLYMLVLDRIAAENPAAGSLTIHRPTGIRAAAGGPRQLSIG